MNFKIEESQYPVLIVELNQNEALKLETGAMVSKTAGIDLSGKMNGGGFFQAVSKSLLGGENFFATTATAQANNQNIILAPKGLGSIYHIKLTGKQWYLEDGAFLASSPTVEYDTVIQQGLGNVLFGRTGGLFILKTRGVGELFVESFGTIKEITLEQGQEYVVDNSHLVAWEETVQHKIEVASGVFGYKTGEGLVTRLSGEGKILIQTRNIESFAKIITPFMPTQRLNN
ncbi:MAG: TIGR00266 family protein [Mycoplasmatales bacterium]